MVRTKGDLLSFQGALPLGISGSDVSDPGLYVVDITDMMRPDFRGSAKSTCSKKSGGSGGSTSS